MKKQFLSLLLCGAAVFGLTGCGKEVSTPSSAPFAETYTEVDITVAADPDLPLAGRLTLPKGIEKPPVVILVQGSGASDMDETIFDNKPFHDIAIGLAEQGIATIRYNKRYYTYPEHAKALGADVTVEDEVLDDVLAAIKLAKSDDRVDASRIFVLGHSLGGMLTPKIADLSPELAGIISMAGSLRQLWEITYDQNMELANSLRPTLSETDLATLDGQLAQIEADKATLEGNIELIPNSTPLIGIPAGYWKSLKRCNGMLYIDNCTMPILVLQGDVDFQVFPERDYQLWLDTVGNRKNVTCKLYEGLNHLMMPTNGLRSVEDYKTANNVDPNVINDIAAFILHQ